MRVSILTHDSGYAAHCHLKAHGQRVSVKLNGEHQALCITADDEAGMIVRHKVPIEYDHDRQCSVDEVVHGKVEIEVYAEVCL